MKNRTLYLTLFVSSVAWLLTACTPRQQTGRGFVFPGGDAERGQLAFVELGCINLDSAVESLVFHGKC